MFRKPEYRMLPAVAALSLAMTYAVAPAGAADAVFDEPPAPSAPPVEALPLPTWTGIYAGVTLGYGFGDTDLPGNSIDTDGVLGNVFGGAQYQFDSFVVGAEGDIGYNWMEGANAGASADSGFEGTLRARLGYAPTDRLLVYGTGGLAMGKIGVSTPAGSDSNTMVGWTAGAGVDLKMTEMMFGRVEYRYTDYGNEDFTIGGATQGVDVNQNKIMLGVGVQF